MSSKQALAMWGAQQLTRMGKPIPDSTKRACGDGLREAVSSGQRRTIYVRSNDTGWVVDQHDGFSNAECEAWALDKYDINDYTWGYAR